MRKIVSKIGLACSALMLLSACELMAQKPDFSKILGISKPNSAQSMRPAYSGSSMRGSVPASGAHSSASSYGGASVQARRRPVNNPSMPTQSHMAPSIATPASPYGSYPSAPNMQATSPASPMMPPPPSPYSAAPLPANPYSASSAAPTPPTYGGAPTSGGFDSFYDQMPGGAPAYAQPQSYSPRGASTSGGPIDPSTTMPSFDGYGSGVSMPSASGFDVPDIPDGPSQYDVQRQLNRIGWGQNSDGSYNPWRKYKPDAKFEPMSEAYEMDAELYERSMSEQPWAELAFLDDSYRKLNSVPEAPIDLDMVKERQESFKSLEAARDEANNFNAKLRSPESDVGVLGGGIKVPQQEGETVDVSSPDEPSTSFLAWMENLITIDLGKGGDLFFKDNPHRDFKDGNASSHRETLLKSPSDESSSWWQYSPSAINDAAAASEVGDVRVAKPPIVRPYKAPDAVILNP